MFYRKNVSTMERVARVALGVALGAGGLWWYGTTTSGWIALASGAFAAGTGLVGFCPACALVGRRAVGGSR